MTSTSKTVWVPSHHNRVSTKTPWARCLGLLRAAKIHASHMHKLAIGFIGVAVPVAGWSLQQSQLEITRLQESAKYIEDYEDFERGVQQKWTDLQKRLDRIFVAHGKNMDTYDFETLQFLGMQRIADGTIELDEENKERKQVEEIVRHFRTVIRCVRDDRCSRESVVKYYKADMCAFRSYLYSYVDVMSAGESDKETKKRWRLADKHKSESWQPHFGDFAGFTKSMCNPSTWLSLARKFMLTPKTVGAHVASRRQRQKVRENATVPNAIGAKPAFGKDGMKLLLTRDVRQEPKEPKQRTWGKAEKPKASFRKA